MSGRDALAAVSRALVIGFGRSGRAAATALADAGVDVLAADTRTDVAAPPPSIRLHAGSTDEHLLRLLAEVDLVVPSPGVPEHAPPVRAAERRGLPVWSEPELAWRIAPRRVIGVTGTNGKTTVTEMITAMCAAPARTVVACGNIGAPLSTVAPASPTDALLVCELSSFQLRFAGSLRPEVGVLTNLAPDHLDWHGDAERYARAKARLWEAQGTDDWAVGNADDPPSVRLVRGHPRGRRAWFSVGERLPGPGVHVTEGTFVAELPGHTGPVVEAAALATAAPHHLANVAAAICAALLVGADVGAVAEAARTYRPGPHRQQVVATIGGIEWIDDSKATNPHAAAAALRAQGSVGQVVWIAGGLAKGVDLGVLADELHAVRHAVLLGQAAPILAEVAASAGVPTVQVSSIEEAVAAAAAIAGPGDRVLLAPACASQDQFRDYVERGERFTAAVAALPAPRGAARGDT